MKRTSFLSVIFLTAFLAFAQEVEQNIEQESTISVEIEEKKTRNHRRIVVSAVMMMLFVGLAMGSVSSLNPN